MPYIKILGFTVIKCYQINKIYLKYCSLLHYFLVLALLPILKIHMCYHITSSYYIILFVLRFKDAILKTANNKMMIPKCRRKKNSLLFLLF